MSDAGWIRVQRRVHPRDPRQEFYGDGPLQLVWTNIIAWANWTDADKPLPRQGVIVRRGQVATSVRELAEATGLTRHVVEGRLRKLVEAGRIVLEAPARHSHENRQDFRKGNRQDGTFITVLKYDEYQSPDSDDRQDDQQDTRTRTGKTSGTSEQVNKGNKLTKTNPPIPPPASPSEGAGDRDRRVRLMAGRIVSAVSADAFASLIDEDRRTLLRHYRTSERAQAAVQRLLRAKNVDSPEAWARSQLVEILMHVIDRPERDVHEPAASDPSRVPYMTSAGDRCCSGCVGATRALLKPDGSGAWDVWCTSCGVSGEGADIDAAVKSFHERMEVRHVEASP
jgi:hypothetical protein